MNTGTMVLRFTVHRFRKLYLCLIVYLTLLAVIARLPTDWIPNIAISLLPIPFMGLLLATVFAFVNVEADFASPSSAYSPYLLRLPLRTSTLVLWPTLASAAWAFVMWMGVCVLYFHPRAIVMPAIWPAAMFAAVALFFQGILWIPVRFGGLRLLMALILSMTIVLFGVIAAESGWQEYRISLVYLSVSILSLGFAWYGLDRARTSPSGRSRQTAEPEMVQADSKNRKIKPPFSSRESAQFWLEWRRQGKILPIASTIALILFTLPAYFNKEQYENFSGTLHFFPNVWIYPMLPAVPWIPLLMATAIGMGARRADLRGSEGVYHLYYATRPMHNEEIYRAKLKAITASVLVTSAITIGFLFYWLSWPTKVGDNKTEALYFVYTDSFDAQSWLVCASILVVAGLWMWRNQAVGAFVDYLPSRTLSQLYPLAVSAVGATWFVLTQLGHDYLQSASAHGGLTALFSVLLIIKLSLAVIFGKKLLALRPEAKRPLQMACLRWLVTATVSAAALSWLSAWVESRGLHVYYLLEPIPVLIAILVVPLVRPTVARWALEAGRHR